MTKPGAPALRRELGLRDVSLFAITCMVGTRWLPAMAHAGPGSVTLLILAAVFLTVPLARAVGTLTVKYRGAPGGMYVWTREDFGPWHGFLCFWVYWIAIAFWFPGAAMFYMGAGFEALGPAYSHLAGNRAYLCGTALVAIWLALGANLVGMKVGKWVENAGAAAVWLLGLGLGTMAAVAWAKHGSATRLNFMPVFAWGSVSLWATIAYAMTGLELAGLMGGEIHDPERTLPRAGWIASAATAAFYSVGTIALLVLLPAADISELQGLAEAGGAAGQALGAVWPGPAIAMLVMASAVGQIGGLGTAVSRLPFAVGVDQLMPRAFGRVHPRWGTPHISILAFGITASFLLVAIQFGDTIRAAYQALVSLSIVTGFLPFVYVFGSAWKAGRRISAASGLAVTGLAIACTVIPTDEVGNPWLFELKVLAGTAAVIGSARIVYNSACRRALGRLGSR